MQVRTESAHRAVGKTGAQIAASGASVKKLFEATFFKMSPARQPGEEQPVEGECGTTRCSAGARQVLTEPADEIRSRFQHRLMGEGQPHGTQAVRGCLPRGPDEPHTGPGCGGGHHANHTSQPVGTAAVPPPPSKAGEEHARQRLLFGTGAPGREGPQGPGLASVLLRPTRSPPASPIRPLQLSSRQQRASRLLSATFL